jgi:hypothetical protein
VAHLIIDGSRLLTEDSTFTKLKQNIQRTFPSTRKRQHVAGAVAIRNIKYTMVGGNMLRVQSTVSSSEGGDHQVDVVLNRISEAPDGVTFKDTSGVDKTITPVQLARTTLRVSCSCLDFKFRFATWNFNDNSLVGNKPPPYVRKTTTRPEANPLKTPGVCKHIIKVVDTIKAHGILT